MYAGRMAEQAPTRALFETPLHPYTRGLLRSMPGALPSEGRRLPTLPGVVPDASRPPAGCRFHPRCAERFDRCDVDEPQERPIRAGRSVACHLQDRGAES